MRRRWADDYDNVDSVEDDCDDYEGGLIVIHSVEDIILLEIILSWRLACTEIFYIGPVNIVWTNTRYV